MAQIIKHRRGSIDSVKNSTSRKGELIMATGSVGNLNGPFVFIGTDEGSGLYSPASKLYAGSEAPTLTATTYGTTLDGTPFYASSNKSLYILNNSNVGNSQIDLTGNIEGNTISGVTINNLQSTNVTASYFTGAFVGDATGLFNIPATGVTGLNLSKIYSGSIQVTTDSETGEVHIDATNGVYVSGSTLDVKGNLVLTGSLFASNIHGTGSIYLYPDQNDVRHFEIYNTGMGDTHIKASGGYSFFGDDTNYLKIDDSLQIVSITGVNGVHVSSSLNVNGNTSVTGALVVSNGSATFDSGLVAQNSNMLLTSGSNLIVQNDGNVQVDYIRGNTDEWNYLALNSNGVFNPSGVELASSGNISLWAEGGTVNVTGSLNVTGDIVFSGSINIGDNLTGDTINFNGEVSSSILPQTGSSFDLGSSGKTWNNVWAENAHFTNISIGDITLNDLSLPGDLTVSGTTTLSGSVYVEDLIQGRVTLAGAGGQLVDNENFTYDLANGFLLNTSGSININTSGSLNMYTHDGDDIYMSSSSDITFQAATDVTITAGDDLRLYSNDIFSLRNYSIDESITLVTNYNGSSKTLEFDVNGNLTIPEGFTGSYLDINTQAQLASAAVEDLTDNRIVLAGVGGELEDDANFTFDGTTFKIGDGDFEVDVANGNTRTSGSLGVIGSSDFSGNVSLLSGNTLYLNHIADYSNNALDITTYGGLTLESTNALSVVLQSDNAEDGTNYLHVNQYGVDFTTYDFTSGLTHKVLLDNTGSLKLENVSLSLTGSLNVSGSLDVYGATHIHNDLYVSGNLAILGSGSVVHISASQVDIGTNIINLNTFAPFERFAGLAVYDSGSNVGVTGSLLWDSQENVWIYSHPDHMGSVASARLISGPLNTGSLGNETGLTNGHFPIATGDDHISDSLLTYIGTTLALNTNKFTVDSGTGDTLINGNFTIEGVGATDNGEYSSYIVFRNDENVLGFVATTDTLNETDRLLGYNATSGVLEFSSLIDGGTY